MRAQTRGATGGQRPVTTGRKTPPAPSSTTLPALSAISSSTQRNTCNTMKAKYSRSGQWHGWNLLRDMTCVKLEACFGPRDACISLAYGAIRRLQRRRTSRYGAPAQVLDLLKAGNRALESVGFITQRAPHRPLPTGHHSNDLVPLRHCPPAHFPMTTLYYVTSLDHRHLICRTITAGGCVERCANCSPSNHARRDSLCWCRPQHLARHAGDNITD